MICVFVFAYAKSRFSHDEAQLLFSRFLVLSDKITASGDASVGDVNIDLLRATEYEQLSRLCMDENQ